MVNYIFIDPDAPTDIVAVAEDEIIRVRIRFTDTDEALSFMEIFFECDKINLKEIAEDNPELTVTTEIEEEAQELLDYIDSALEDYLGGAEYGDEEDT